MLAVLWMRKPVSPRVKNAKIQGTKGLYLSFFSISMNHSILRAIEFMIDDLTFAVANSDMWLAFCRTQLSANKGKAHKDPAQSDTNIPSGYLQI